ncbi:sialic acid-binding Ig-like lectin 12 [Pelobates cultripes]|uniref:Sialic acid-binding Ig-like lectin 12, partial n=1 Tax=Pelobates cultripes TaxID=61616 RepID=A0AAD1T6V4_PELCU|nr:sialic acid-binding Ig-like lectin 12 [Pelobates cultripes]
MRFRRYTFQYQGQHLALIFILSLLWKDNTCQQTPSYSIKAPIKVIAQTGFCVYVPCTFTVPGNNLSTNARGIVYKGTLLQFNNVASKTGSGPSIGGKVQLVGDVLKGDCTFRITDVQDSDESQYRFRIEDGFTLYTYLEIQPYVKVTDMTCKSQSSYNLKVPSRVVVQRGLCAYIPCTFTIPADKTLTPNAQGIWYKENKVTNSNPVASKTGSVANTGGRILLTGDVSKGDCSFSINDVQEADESPYRFRIEDGSLKFNYMDNFPYVKVTELTEKPLIFPQRSLLADQEATLTCMSPVRCTGSPPSITWQGSEELNSGKTQSYRVDYEDGNWTYISYITFTPSKKSNMSSLTCTVHYRASNATTSADIILKVEHNTCQQTPSYSIKAPIKVIAQTGFCVYVPCTFTVPGNNLSTNARGIVYKGTLLQFNNVASKTGSGPSIGGKVQLVGDVLKGDCTFRITDVQDSDESQYRFRIEDGFTLYTYLEIQPYVKVTDMTCKSQSSYNLKVPSRVVVQRGLCAYIPCTFTIPADKTLTPNAQGIWYKENKVTNSNPVASKTGSVANTGGRILLTGDVSKGDCSFSINDVQEADESPYRFRIEDGSLKFNYMDNFPYVKVTELTEKPLIFPQMSLLAGQEATLTCMSPARCTGSPPSITWQGSEELNSGKTQSYRVDYEDEFGELILATALTNCPQHTFQVRVSWSPRNYNPVLCLYHFIRADSKPLSDILRWCLSRHPATTRSHSP